MVLRETPILSLVSGTPGVDAVYEWLNLGPSDTITNIPTKNLWLPHGLVVGDAGGGLTSLAVGPNAVLGRLGGGLAALTRADLLTLLEVVLAGGTAGEAGKLVQLDAAGHLDLSVIPPGVGGGAINDGENLGGANAVFLQAVADKLQFRTLKSLTTDSLRVLTGGNELTFTVILSDALPATSTRLWSSLKVEDELAALDTALQALIAAKIGALSEDGAPTLAANLDIGLHGIFSGVEELIRWDGAQLLINGTPLLVPNITAAQAGDVLLYDDVAGEWVNGPNPSAPVDSVFGRTGVVVATLGDYAATLITNDSGVTGADVAAALDALDAGKSDTGHTHPLAIAAGPNGFMSGVDKLKLDGIESGAAADQRADEVPFTPAGGIVATDVQAAIEEVAGGGAHTHDDAIAGGASGFMPGSDKAKLDGIEANATADQTGAEIKAAYEAEADTNPFTDAEQSKLAGVEAGATADQTGAEIKTAYEGQADTNAFTDAEKTKLAGVESGAKDDQSAAEVPFTPTGAIAATDVQGALAELDTEKAATGHTHSNFGTGSAGMTPGPVAADVTAGRLLRADGTWATPVAPVLRPFSCYPANASNTYFGLYTGAGANSKNESGMGVIASLPGDSKWQLRFELPGVIPAGTAKLRLLALANAAAGDAKVNPQWASVAVGEDPSSATLNAEGTQTATWGVGDEDKYKQVKVDLDADTLVAGEILVLDLVFETTGFTLAAESIWQASVIWE